MKECVNQPSLKHQMVSKEQVRLVSGPIDTNQPTKEGRGEDQKASKHTPTLPLDGRGGRVLPLSSPVAGSSTGSSKLGREVRRGAGGPSQKAFQSSSRQHFHRPRTGGKTPTGLLLPGKCRLCCCCPPPPRCFGCSTKAPSPAAPLRCLAQGPSRPLACRASLARSLCLA